MLFQEDKTVQIPLCEGILAGIELVSCLGNSAMSGCSPKFGLLAGTI